MQPDPAKPMWDVQMVLLIGALEEMRDALVTISIEMKDLLSDTPSQARAEAMADAGRYLDRIRFDSKNGLG
jgi:hypothetical protein